MYYDTMANQIGESGASKAFVAGINLQSSLRNGNAHYIGATVDLDRRIEQHNASRVGGAHRTAKRGPGWRCTWYVDGFSSFQQSLQFEYALKRETRSFGYTPAARLRTVRSLIDRWTMQKEATPMLCIQQ